MNYYELMYIIDSSLESEEISQVKKEIENFLTSEGSDIYSKSDWGRTRLAYEIEKQKYGHYIVLRFSAKADLIKQLREKFGLMDAVLSHLCVSLDEEPERIAEEEIEIKKERTVPESVPVVEKKKEETKPSEDEKSKEESDEKSEEESEEKSEEESDEKSEEESEEKSEEESEEKSKEESDEKSEEESEEKSEKEEESKTDEVEEPA